MHVNIAFRHMDTSPALQSYTSKKLQHVLGKYISGQNIDSRVVFSVERFWHIADFTINVNGLTVKSSEKSENMYSSVDLALEKLERQMRRYKEKIRGHKPAHRNKRFTMDVILPNEGEMGEEIEDDSARDEAVKLVRRDTYDAPSMSVDAAVMQLNLRDGQFFVFTNSDTERVNVVHRRDDGSYGLIDPESEVVTVT